MAVYETRSNTCAPCTLRTTVSPSRQPTMATIGNKETFTNCHKKVIAVTKTKDKVSIMFEDCTFALADLDVVNISSFITETVENLNKKIIALEDKNQSLETEIETLKAKPDKDTTDINLSLSGTDLTATLGSNRSTVSLASLHPATRRVTNTFGTTEVGYIHTRGN